jgi:hypothetical protein
MKRIYFAGREYREWAKDICFLRQPLACLLQHGIIVEASLTCAQIDTLEYGIIHCLAIARSK